MPARREFSDADVVQLREYLLKGGFMWSDDFWGSRAWAVWEQQIGRVLPPERFPIVDIPVDARDVSDDLQREAHPPGAGDQPVAQRRRAHPSAELTARS